VGEETFKPAYPSSGSRPRQPVGIPVTAWPPWAAPAALFGGLVLAAVAGLVVDIPAVALGASITSSHVPGGVEIADTVVQDGAFVFAALFFAQLGGRRIAAWQFGLRGTPPLRAAGMVLATLLAFLLFSVIWAVAIHAEKEKLLEQLGAGESTSLLLLSAALTCVIAPVCEEFLFRGFIFNALRNWRGVGPAAVITGLVFGAVHIGSAPAVDLVPLAMLGFGLCLLYHYTGSLYPCIAVHSLNNSVAFGSLESWAWWQVILLMLVALVLIGLLALALMRVGVISREQPAESPDAFVIGPGSYDRR
jgi:membrane protease YdiL (CAAX protease family)